MARSQVNALSAEASGLRIRNLQSMSNAGDILTPDPSVPSTPMAFPPVSASTTSTGKPSSPPDAPQDYSLPISVLLREGTKSAHTTAEHSAGAIALAAGTLAIEEYLRYLIVLWCVYHTLETLLDDVDISQFPSAEAVYELWKKEGKMLRRSEKLAEDAAYFLERLKKEPDPFSTDLDPTTELDDSFWAKSELPRPQIPLPPYLRTMFLLPPADLTSYVRHLKTMASPALLLSHAYVRYLGDLSGGQLVAARIRRTYDLPAHPADPTRSGVRFYHFDLDHQVIDSPTGEGQVEGNDELKSEKYQNRLRVEEIKQWFRETMDVFTENGVFSDDAEKMYRFKAELVQEAIKSFQSSTRLFSLLKPPSDDSRLSQRLSAGTQPQSPSSRNGQSKVVYKASADHAQGPIMAAPLWWILSALLALAIASQVFKWDPDDIVKLKIRNVSKYFFR